MKPEAIEAMAANPNAGSVAMGVIAGVGMGNVVGGAMTGAAQTRPAAPSAGTPPPLPDPVQWFAALDNQQAGPFTPEQFQQMIAEGQVNRETLFWKQGMAGFILAERGENAGGRGMVGGQAPRAGGV